ncbi:hypothetical protein [Streptacidiphilus neutrinimicus]|uniref:hypothetical protein n=1 Tax=Streptacidiphilus neutrinimicus TaxID=105420 RepID=UPI0005AA7579|nr:hypothetical protein [Streptacidiphilus neutrinimicus]
MTYDIYFLRVEPGRTFDETMQEVNSAYDPEAEPDPMNLTGDQRAVWDRLTQRISREVGPITSEEYLYSLTLWRDGPAGHLQLDYAGDSASIEISYRYPGQAALPIMAEAYRIARMVEEECGLEGYDAEVDQSIRTGEVDVAAAKLGGVSHWAHSHLT